MVCPDSRIFQAQSIVFKDVKGDLNLDMPKFSDAWLRAELKLAGLRLQTPRQIAPVSDLGL